MTTTQTTDTRPIELLQVRCTECRRLINPLYEDVQPSLWGTYRCLPCVRAAEEMKEEAHGI